MRCEDKCALATMVCIDCGVCSAHAFFGPGSAGECMACTADRIRKGQEKRMSKSLSPPEVVQALLDGKTVQRSGVTEMRWRGVTLEHRRKPAAVWVPSDATLDGFLYSIYNDVWYIVPTTYDWTEARKRMAAGKMVRSLSSPDDGSPGSYLCRQNEYGLYVREDGLAYEFNKADFDGRWEDA